MLTTIPTLATDGSGYRKTPFWVKPGVVANYWQRSRTMVDTLPQKLGSVQVFAGTTLSATRTQAGMAGIILNSKG
jgi:Phage capsid protein